MAQRPLTCSAVLGGTRVLRVRHTEAPHSGAERWCIRAKKTDPVSYDNFTFERTELEDSHVTRTARLNAQVTAAQLNENMHQVGPCTARWLDPSCVAFPLRFRRTQYTRDKAQAHPI